MENDHDRIGIRELQSQIDVALVDVHGLFAFKEKRPKICDILDSFGHVVLKLQNNGPCLRGIHKNVGSLRQIFEQLLKAI